MEEAMERRRASSGALFTSRKCPPGPGLESTCQLPLGMLYSPFCATDEATTATLDTEETSLSSGLPPILCLTCCSYLNLYCSVTDNGTWTCALCGARNVVPQSAASPSHNAVWVAPMYSVQQPIIDASLPQQQLQNDADSVTIVLVVDANLPAAELQAIGRAVATLDTTLDNNAVRWGLVVYDEAVAVYQLGLPPENNGIAMADVLTSHVELTDDLLQTQAYLGRDDAAVNQIQTCLAALSASDGNDENIVTFLNNNATPATRTSTSPVVDTSKQPLSRLERLKMAKAARQAKAAAAVSSTNTDEATTTLATPIQMPEQSPWMERRKQRRTSGESVFRCTGEALQVAMDLATATTGTDPPKQPSRTARVWTFTNGCPNLGDGSVVAENLATFNKSRAIVDALQMARAVEFYKVLAQTAVDEGLSVDVFLSGVSELGLSAYQALVEPSAGYALVHESFTTPHLTQNLQYIWEFTYASHLSSLASQKKQVEDHCTIDVRFSSFLTPTHFCGPGELVSDAEKTLLVNEASAFAAGAALAAEKRFKTNNLPSRDMLETCMTRFRVGRVDPMSTFSLMFQFNDFFQKDSFALFQCVARYLNRAGTHYVTRVSTHRLPLAKDVGEFLDAVDEEVIPVILAKEAVYRSMHGREVEGQSTEEPSEEQLEQLAYATQLDLDATVARVSHAYRLLGLQEGPRSLDLTEEGGVRAAGSSLDFAFPPELGEALKRLYHLRRGPLLSPGPMRSRDDRLQLRTLFLRFPLEESLLAMTPSTWALTDPAGPIRPVPPETLALWDSAALAGDSFHSLFVWCGKNVQDVEQTKEYCQQFLAARAEERFPMPDMHILYDGDSMSRRFTAILSPSHGDPIEHSLAHFPGLSGLQPDELGALRSKFQFYDASTDPSFRSWFWKISSATSKSKDEGWSLCE